ncbi:hypothetical protein D3C72_2492500 [compost metagenome]
MLVTAAADIADAIGDRSVALIDVIAHWRADSVGTLANRDGDGLAVGQGHHDRAAGNWRSDRCGVDNATALGH